MCDNHTSFMSQIAHFVFALSSISQLALLYDALVPCLYRDTVNKDAVKSLSYYQTAMGSADPATTSFIGLNHETVASTSTSGASSSTALIVEYGTLIC